LDAELGPVRFPTGHSPGVRRIPLPLCICQIGIGECDETLAAETRLVTRMNDPCRQFTQSQHRMNVIGHIRVVQIVDEGTVVDSVA
jgi:hypothetical protein